MFPEYEGELIQQAAYLPPNLTGQDAGKLALRWAASIQVICASTNVEVEWSHIVIIDFMASFFRIDLSFTALDCNTPTRRLTAEPVSPTISDL